MAQNKLKRQPNGAGSIVLRNDGRWMARFYITCPDGTRKRQQIIKKTRTEVQDAMRREQELARQGSPVVHNGQTVGQWLDYWLANIAPNKVRETTAIGYEGVIRNHIKPAIGKKTLISLRPMDVQLMIDNVVRNGGSARLAHKIQTALSSALHTAVNREIIHTNVSRKVDIPKIVMKERGIWQPDHITKFLNRIKDHRLYPLFELYFTYGMRRGEGLGLRWCDIDFDTKTIHIRQQLVGMGQHIFIQEPKTTNSKRDLPLSPRMEAIFKEYRATRAHVASEGLIFQTENGTNYQPNNVFRFFRKMTRALGLPEISIHDIRHTVATIMKNGDVPIKDAQMALGHASPLTTMQHYQHSDMNGKGRAISAVEIMRSVGSVV